MPISWIKADTGANSFSVGTHFNQAGTTYTKVNGLQPIPSVNACVAALAAIGVRGIRDTYDNQPYSSTTSTFVASVKACLATAPANSTQSSINCEYVIIPGGANAVSNFGSSTTVGSHFYNFLNSGIPASNMVGAETINEQDGNAPSTYAGGPSTPGSVASVQQDFFNAMGVAYPGVARLAPSMATPTNSANVTGISAWCDYDNFHLYSFASAAKNSTSGGGYTRPTKVANWQTWLGDIGLWNGTGCQICPGTQGWVTETGLPQYYQVQNGGGFTDERAGALFTVTAWLYLWAIYGNHRVSIYDGIDDNIAVTTYQQRFGCLMRGDLSLKQGGQAMKNFFALLYDPAPTSFTLNQNIGVTITGQTTGLWSIFLQYSNGDLGIICWQDLKFNLTNPGIGYGAAAPFHYPSGVCQTFQPLGVTITLSQQFAYSTWHTPVDDVNTTPNWVGGPGNQITVQPNESPQFIKLHATQSLGKIVVPSQQNLLYGIPTVQ